MSKAIKLLVVEDSEDDARLVIRMLRRGGYNAQHERVESAAAMAAALQRQTWDAIVSDYNMPGFSGLDALRILRATALDIPFILISGTVGEEIAVDALKAGANDYVIKNNLSRLALVLERELKEAAIRAEHRRVQRKLAESEHRLRTIIETEPECVKVVGADGRLLEMNAAGLAMLEADSLAAVQSRPLLEFIVPEHRAAFIALHQRVIRGESGSLEFEVIGLKGGRRWLETHAAPLGGAHGDVAALLGITRDITERKKSEAALRESEAWFRSLTELSADWIWKFDEKYRFVAVGMESGDKSNIRPPSFLGKAPWQIPGANLSEPEWAAYRARLDARQTFRNFEYSRPSADGTSRWVSISGEPIFDASGIFMGYRGIGTDITERKRAEHELQRFRMAMDVSADSIYLTDPATMRFVYLNNTACQRLGYSREQLLQKGPQDVLPMDREEINREYGEVIAAGDQGLSHERLFVRSDGSKGWTELHRRALRTESGTLIVTIGRDITERKRMEQVVLQAERRFRSIFDNAIEGIFLASQEGRLITSNPANARMLGYDSPEELITAVADAGTQLYVDPEDRRRMLGMLDAQGSVRGFETRMRRKDGEVIWASLSVRVVGDDAGAASHVLGMSQDITGQRRANQVLALEHAVARHLAGAESGPEGLQAVIRTLCESEDWEVGRYWQVDETAGVLRFGGSWGTADPAIARFTDESRGVVFAAGVGLAGMVWQSGEPLWASDTSNDPRVAQSALARDAGMRGAFVFPVTSDGNVVGVIGISSREVRPPDDRLLAAVRVIGGQAGQFLRRKQGEDRIKRLNRVYAVLSGINSLIVRVRDREELLKGACRIAVEEGGLRMAWIGMVDRTAMELVPAASAGTTQDFRALVNQRFSLREAAPLGNALSARAIREKRVIFSNDVQNDPHVVFKEEHATRGSRSMAIFPLQISDEIIGLFVLYSEETDFFDEEELKLLTELAGDISFAIDHIDKQERLDYLAYYDALTGLANRSLFHERLTQYLRTSNQGETKLALALMNVERFKTINDSLGRQAGDDFLKQLAGRLTGAAEGANIARIGGDQFAIMLPEVKGRSEVVRSVERIWRECFTQPFRINGAELRISAKAGMALHPTDGADAEALFANAEAALKNTQETGERHQFHTRDLTEGVAEQLALENQLRQALEKEQFVLHYQPKVDLETRTIVGVEALIRWQSPELGLVPPIKFIPLMEETGLILEVGTWALKQAALDHRKWFDLGLKPPRVAVNVSPIQLRQRDFVAAVERAIIEGIAPTGIDLEITESLIMEDVQGSIAKLKAARDLGVRIAIDDFGTGYSSLGYLAKLPVQTLKIDRSFIITMLGDPDTMTLVQTIISLAHSLRLKVVAEGVDAEEQAKMLRLLRCDEMQGYLYSKPVPFEAMTALLTQGAKS